MCTILSLSLFQMPNEMSILLQVMDGFMIIVSSTGNILFVTHTVETLLGHPQVRRTMETKRLSRIA